jgi:hypothetical protein
MSLKSLHIQNFKSIKNLKLNTKRVNIFIGEPNSGKTNIIEALSFFSINATDQKIFKEIFRFETTDDLFPDSNLSKPISIATDKFQFTLELHRLDNGGVTNDFLGTFSLGVKKENKVQYRIPFDGNIYPVNSSQPSILKSNICFYSFKKHRDFVKNLSPFLSPPFGENIPSLLLNNEELKRMVLDIFRNLGFKFEIRPKEGKLYVGKDIDGVIYSYPYLSTSETLQRIIFMTLALESNKNMVLLFDEPEANTFPFYTKYLAERIALDKSNQYFLTTHNPFLLFNIIEKTPVKDLNVFVTKMIDFQTACKKLTPTQVEEIIDMGYDSYFNLDKFFR